MNLIRKKKFYKPYSDYLDDFIKALPKSFNKGFLKYEYTKYKTKSKKNYYLVNKKNFKKIRNFFSRNNNNWSFKHFLIKKLLNISIKIILNLYYG